MVKNIFLLIVSCFLLNAVAFADGEVYIADCKVVHKNIKYYKEKVKENPNDVCALYNLSLEYSRKNKVQSELLVLDDILNINPKDVDVYYDRAQTYYVYKNYGLYYREFARAIKNIPNYVEGYIVVSEAYQNILDYENALKYVNMAIKLKDKPDEYLLLQRGQIYQNMGMYSEAIEDFTKVLELNPTEQYAYYSRSSCYKSIGQIMQAEADEENYKKLRNEDKYNITPFEKFYLIYFRIKDRLFYTKELV